MSGHSLLLIISPAYMKFLLNPKSLRHHKNGLILSQLYLRLYSWKVIWSLILLLVCQVKKQKYSDSDGSALNEEEVFIMLLFV
jgi:hypothetical protein